MFVLIICPLLFSDKGKHSRVTRVNIQMRSDCMTDSLMKLGTQFNFIHKGFTSNFGFRRNCLGFDCKEMRTRNNDNFEVTL